MIAITRIVPRIVGYLRVSTDKQGKSGLGMDAQRAALEQCASQTGATTLRTYVEVESGRRPDRPELAKALAHAKRSKATLVVAKLDRLSRNVAFLATVMDSDCDFLACDNPNANRLTLHTPLVRKPSYAGAATPSRPATPLSVPKMFKD
ncbi:MAG: recombinase family protein [Pirellulales bacterium]